MDIFIQWLIANSLKGAVLIVAIFLVQFVFSKQIPPKWKYLMWLLVAMRLVMPSLLELDSSIFNLKNIWQNETVNSVQSAVTQQKNVAIIEQDLNQAASIDVLAFLERIELSSILFFTWAVVSIFLFLYLFWKNLSILALVRKEKPIVKSKWLELLENCKQELKLYTPVQLVETSHIKTPALMGFVRPRILLPTGILNAMTENEIRLIFMHELTHLKCGDIIINWTISLIQIVHWFNPLVWIAFSKTREARELACDDDMLSFLGQSNSKKYGQTIIKLLDFCYNETRITGMVGILENKKLINRRIKMIKNRNRKTKKGVVFALILLFVMGTVFLSEAKEKKKTIVAKKSHSLVNNVKADRCTIAGEKIMLSGNACVPYGKFIVYADKATVNIKSTDLNASGNVRIHVLGGKQEKKKIFKAKSVTGNLSSGYFKFTDFIGVRGGATFKAKSCVLNPDGKITSKNGKLKVFIRKPGIGFGGANR